MFQKLYNSKQNPNTGVSSHMANNFRVLKMYGFGQNIFFWKKQIQFQKSYTNLKRLTLKNVHFFVQI